MRGNSFIQSIRYLPAVIFCSLMPVVFAGCDRNNSYYDHVPPQGKGSLVIDNHTGDDISIFVNGERMGGVNGGDYTIIDLNPGFIRLVLAADHVDRSYRDDIDLLDGRLTIIDVRASSANNYYTYDAVITFE